MGRGIKDPPFSSAEKKEEHNHTVAEKPEVCVAINDGPSLEKIQLAVFDRKKKIRTVRFTATNDRVFEARIDRAGPLNINAVENEVWYLRGRLRELIYKPGPHVLKVAGETVAGSFAGYSRAKGRMVPKSEQWKPFSGHYYPGSPRHGLLDFRLPLDGKLHFPPVFLQKLEEVRGKLNTSGKSDVQILREAMKLYEGLLEPDAVIVTK